MEPNHGHDEIVRLLNENQRLLTENNSLLKSMRRSGRLAALFKILWYVFVIGSLWYSYVHYIEPNLEQIQATINTLQQTPFSKETLQEWFNSNPGKE